MRTNIKPVLVLPVAALALVSGCGPAYGGVVALSRGEDGLKLGIVACDNSHIRNVGITKLPANRDDTSAYIELGSLTTSTSVPEVLELDPSAPGQGWSGDWPDTSSIIPGVQYSIAGWGGDWVTEETVFTLKEWERLGEEEWLFPDIDTTELRTADDLEEVKSATCDK